MTSDKLCSDHKDERRRSLSRCCGGLLVFAFLVLLVILITWAVLQPRKPRFILQDATIFNLNVSAPNIISTTVQVTVSSHNPNSRIGIYYDRMSVYATYHSQQITYMTGIPPVYQGHHDTNVWSPFIYGVNVPVAPYNGISLGQDQSSGAISMIVKLNGRVKWKVGSLITGHYHLHVNCQVNVPLGHGRNEGVIVGAAIKYQLSQACNVNV